jgi:nitroreductase
MNLTDLASKIKRKIRKVIVGEVKYKNRLYLKKIKKYSFTGCKCIDEKQYEAVITRWYHTIEKGLAYTEFRAGFGKNNLEALLSSMENYIADGYSVDSFFYKTALSTLNTYQDKNAAYGYVNKELNDRISALPGIPNDFGGTMNIENLTEEQIQKLDYADFVRSRHSMRHFSTMPIEKGKLARVAELAQHTPSACNRQGWQIRIILNKNLIKQVLINQNGNEGFGHEFTGLILVTGDIRCFNYDRELFEVYIDSGMYAQSILNALHYEHIASVPLSASLTSQQEERVRKLLNIEDSEVLVMFIGIGNYPEERVTTRSERRPATPIYFE